MASQAPHPPWFRMYFPSTPAPPPPPPPPTRPPPPTPAITLISIPIRQNMEESVPLPPAPVEPPPSASAAQPKPPVSPPPPAASSSPPRSPVATFPTSTITPPFLSPSTSISPKPTKTQVAASETVTGKAISRPTSSPKLIKPLESVSPQSPKTKQVLSNPLTLPPPAQINKTEGECKLLKEEKNVPEQHNHGIISGGKRELTTKHEGLSDSEDDCMRVIITLAGENKGAVMELIPSNNKNHSAGNPQSRENGEEISESSYKDENNRDTRMQSQGTSLLNSNVQGLNNSVLCDCTYRQNDPGVRLSLNTEANVGLHHEETI